MLPVALEAADRLPDGPRMHRSGSGDVLAAGPGEGAPGRHSQHAGAGRVVGVAAAARRGAGGPPAGSDGGGAAATPPHRRPPPTRRAAAKSRRPDTPSCPIGLIPVALARNLPARPGRTGQTPFRPAPRPSPPRTIADKG